MAENQLNKKEIWRGGNLLYPIPAVMVSCGRAGERPNILTIAWTGTVCSTPPMVSISVQKIRYSHAILKETGEFVINLVPASLTAAADGCGVLSGRNVDKFERFGLTPEPCDKLSAAPAIAECPVNLECRVTQVLELGSHDMFLATVEAVRVRKDLLDEKGKLDLKKADLMVYSHGEYFRLGELLGSFGYSVRKKA